jgi:predicted protein tyrosine phosphatase
VAVKKWLFICGKNRLRSPTAEAVFAAWQDIETDSAGVNADADMVVSADQILWADIIFVMEQSHRRKLTAKHASVLKGKQVVCLAIPDNYDYMQPTLISLLEAKVMKFIR